MEQKTEEKQQDINERLVEKWSRETAGRDSCAVMHNMMAGVMSLREYEDTKPMYEKLQERGFDEQKMLGLIGSCCEVIPPEQAEAEDLRLAEEVDGDGLLSEGG